MFSRTHYCSVSRAKWIRSTDFHRIYFRSISLLFSHSRAGLPNALFFQVFWLNFVFGFYRFHACCVLRQSHAHCDHGNNICVKSRNYGKRGNYENVLAIEIFTVVEIWNVVFCILTSCIFVAFRRNISQSGSYCSSVSAQHYIWFPLSAVEGKNSAWTQ